MNMFQKKGKENAEEAAMETTETVPEPVVKQKKGKKRKHEEEDLNETTNGADDTMEVRIVNKTAFRGY